MKVLTDIIQGSDAWFEARLGKPSASHASEIITAANGELSKSARKYIFSLIADCFSPGDDVPKFETYAMARGKELEPMAREAFRAETGLPVVEVGLVVATDGICVCSPDGLIPDDAGGWISGAEIKCPTKDVHTGYVLEGVLPDDYKQQIHWSMAVSEVDEWHFWSFHPRLKPLHVVTRRDSYTAKVEAAIAEFVPQYKAAYALALQKLCIPLELREIGGSMNHYDYWREVDGLGTETHRGGVTSLFKI